MTRTFLCKIAITSLSGAGILAMGLPMGLYVLGLSNIEGRPEPPPRTDNMVADSALLQQDFKSQSPIVVRVLNPWTLAGELWAEKAATPDSGAHAVWIIVRNYNSKHLKNHKMSWWHLSGAALTIWVTRNWTRDEIVASAATIVRSTSMSSRIAQ